MRAVVRCKKIFLKKEKKFLFNFLCVSRYLLSLEQEKKIPLATSEILQAASEFSLTAKIMDFFQCMKP